MKRKIKSLLSLFFSQAETLEESKKKWDLLARENSYFHILTNPESQTEKTFRESGRRDVEQYVFEDQWFSKATGKKMLEVGCGVGRLTEFLSRKYDVTGIDISEEMIYQARNRVPAADFKVNDGSHYPFEDNTFDLVFSFIVFQHMPSMEVIEENLKEIYRILKPGGGAKIQVRGRKAKRDSLYYGPWFTKEMIDKISGKLELVKTENEGKKYFWCYFIKQKQRN